MKIAIMQPYFLPYLGYLQLINAVDKFVIYDDVHFINRGWINRNRILINSKVSFITLPLLKASQNSLINELYIVPESKWKSKMIKTVEVNYKRAPYFDQVYPIFENIIHQSSNHLATFLHYSLIQLLDYLKIDTELIPSSSIYKNQDLSGQDRILDIVMKEGSEWYINPIGGTDLYDKNLFVGNGIKLSFLKMEAFKYDRFNEFQEPILSILDLMMFSSVNEIQGYLSKYKLK
ncbi:MAG: hypothetical protein ACJAT1_000060 [Marivirga sp.]|jgi:hypothetical protein